MMRCPTCKHPNVVRQGNPEQYFLVDYLCLDCGTKWHPLRVPPKEFLEKEIEARGHNQATLKWLEEKRQEVAHRV